MNYEEIIRLVGQTRELIFRSGMREDVHMKGAADFVTATDLAISSFLKGELKRLTPEINFFSEEEKGSFTAPTWILDPIDGTTNYVYGYNMSSVSLALHDGEGIAFGVVYNPYTEEYFTAQRGKGAFLNGRPLSVSKRELKDCIIEFGAGSTRKAEADTNFALAKEIFKSCLDIRRICSSALDLCFIAAGRIDGYFEKVLKPWDYAAGSLILTEAGGTVTDYEGNAPAMDRPSSLLASNGIIHSQLLSMIRKHQ